MNEVKHKPKNIVAPKGPNMFVVQLDMRDAPRICGSGIESAIDTLASYAVTSVDNVVIATFILGSREGYLDLSKEMTEGIAETLFPTVVANAANAHAACGCSYSINLRLSEA